MVQPVIEPHLLQQFSRPLRVPSMVLRDQSRDQHVFEH